MNEPCVIRSLKFNVIDISLALNCLIWWTSVRNHFNAPYFKSRMRARSVQGPNGFCICEIRAHAHAFAQQEGERVCASNCLNYHYRHFVMCVCMNWRQNKVLQSMHYEVQKSFILIIIATHITFLSAIAAIPFFPIYIAVILLIFSFFFFSIINLFYTLCWRTQFQMKLECNSMRDDYHSRYCYSDRFETIYLSLEVPI